MAGIFTRPKVLEILNDESLSADERLDRIMSLRGRDIDDGYVSKASAKADKDAALEQAKADWEKNIPKPNIKESEEYKALESEFSGYKAMQTARSSDDFKDVKGKFFETVYGMVKTGDGVPSTADQIAEIKKEWPEYFNPQEPEEKPKNTPQYSQQPGHSGTNPTSEEDKLFKQLSDAWK